MHSEHLRNVQFSWVAFGWFVALAVASLLALALTASGMLRGEETWDVIAMAGCVAVGWGVGGFIAGYKAAAAPILHGAAMGGFTYVVWFVLNLALGGITTGTSAWELLTVRGVALAFLVQAGAAIAGCWLGYRYAPARVD
ncbi:MAG: hypothetical protein ACE5HQ_03850 [Gemmatimonadota bacterium]